VTVESVPQTAKYQIGNIRDLDPADPTFTALRAATDDVIVRTEEDTTATYGVWAMDGAVPDLIALAFEGVLFWRDGYTVREEA
jgi:hypothetical protein